ncbi:uncharacterized protein LOC135123264 [Zophobas morio]|uniref:uncharacterized protein LOC135123264 n=1 Tax=Zophobas morio TaxID=2755281 RepID=UPI00308342CC
MEEKTENFENSLRTTTSAGNEYNNVVLTSVVLELVNNTAIKNFHISSSDQDFAAFDDIVIKLETNNGTEIKAIQLKHSNEKELCIEHLKAQDTDFSISTYFKYFKKIRNGADKLILFTNRSFKYIENRAFKISGEKFDIKPVKANDILQLRENEDSVYKFEIMEENWTAEKLNKIQQYQMFFSKFYLYTNQESLADLKNTTATKFKARYSSSDEVSYKFLRTVSEWNIQDGEKEKLNKYWTERLIALHLFSSQVEPLSFDFVNKKSRRSPQDVKMEIFREAICSFDIALFQKISSKTVKQLWSDFGKNIDFKELNKMRKRYLPTISHIDQNNMDPKTLTQLLWLMDKCPLLLNHCENVKKAIQLCPDKNFILIGEGKIEEWMKNYSVFQNLSNLSQKPDLCQTVMKNFTVSIQGKEEINLETVFGSDEKSLEKITSDNLVEMLDGPICIGGKKETLPEPYIERYLWGNIINIAYLEKVHKNTIIVLNFQNNFDKVKDKLRYCKLIDIDNFLQKKNTCTKKDVNKHENSYDKSDFVNTIYVGSRHYNKSEIQQIYNENTETEKIHYFKISNDGNLEWMESKGGVSDLEGYKLTTNENTPNENALWSSCLDNNINLLIGDPGSGKSVLMKSFKNKCPPKYWTVIINPQDVNLLLHDLSKSANYADLSEKIISNEKHRLRSELDKNLFETCVEIKTVVFVWDAIDEILSENLDFVMNLILQLSRRGFLQWVTSRRYIKTSLENTFSLLALSMKCFSEDEQQHYFRKRLNTFISADKTEVTIEKIKSSFATVEHVDILGIPLQIFMLTELFRQNNERYLKLMENTFLLTDLYDYFISEKINIFYKDKLEIDLQNPYIKTIVLERKQQALKYFESVALVVSFSEEILQRLNFDKKQCVDKVLRSYISLGFISEVQNDVPHFLHDSFVEYFVAIYFSKNINNFNDTFADILFDTKYTNVRFFFDMLLAKNSEAHIAVLYKNYELLQTYDEETLAREDQGGRSALHLISSWGKRYPRVKVTAVGSVAHMVHKDSSFDNKAETKAYFAAAMSLQSKYDIDKRDRLFSATPLYYARKSESLGAELKLLQTKKNELNQLCTSDDIVNILYYSAQLGYDEVCGLFTAELLHNFQCEMKSICTNHFEISLVLACKIGDLKFFENFKKFAVKINGADNEGWTPLHLASVNGHKKVVEYLVTVGAEINRATNDGWTPLLIASANGHEKVVEYLTTANADINRVDPDGLTPLYVASQNGHEKVVEYLATVGAEINRANKNGATPLYIASQNGHEKVVEYLTKVGAKINSADHEGWTPLHIASQNGHEKVVEYLATVGAEINRATNDGWTPLHIASQNGHEKVVEYLVTVGAEIHRCTNDGGTPLHVASLNGHEKVVEFLARVGAEINHRTNDGWTPLHIASQNGHEKVVEFLTKVGAEINSAGNKGWTPLHIASQNGHKKVVEYLATVGAEINRPQNDGVTPLYIASENGHKKVVEYLTKVGAEINRATNDGWTPLHIASQNSHEKVVEYLVTVGAEINRRTNDGWTPLHVASLNGHAKVVKLLARVGAEINRADNEGRTPVHIASQNGHEKVVEYLVTVGAEINRATNNGVTPLHVASFNGHEKVVEYLAIVGAEINHANKNGATPLYVASQNRHEKVVEYLMTIGAEINRADNEGWTPVYVASQNGHEKVVEYLVTVGAEINRATNDGWTPLLKASQNGHEKVVEYLATVGAEINHANKNGVTPLYVASQNGHEKVVEYLATFGAEINRATNDGFTPLYVASQNGHEKVVEYLMTIGAEINRADNEGWTPVYVASQNGHEKVVEYLATVGAEINHANKNGVTPLYIALRNGHEKVVEYLATVGAEINRATNDGWTPLIKAAQNGHERFVEYLATVGGEINHANKNGATPLYVASQNGHEKVVEYLATVGAEINHANKNGATPLYIASQKGHEKVVEYLVSVGAEINRSQNDGWTPLHIASWNGHEKVVEYLATVGAEINRAENNGVTPLYIASENGHEKVVEYLAAVGAEINRAQNDGWTPLHIASWNGHEKVVEYLTTVGAEINCVNKNGATPLYIASLNGHGKVVEYLVTVGAEINRVNNEGWTPIYAASENGHEKVVEYLMTVGAEINFSLKKTVGHHFP